MARRPPTTRSRLSESATKEDRCCAGTQTGSVKQSTSSRASADTRRGFRDERNQCAVLDAGEQMFEESTHILQRGEREIRRRSLTCHLCSTSCRML